MKKNVFCLFYILIFVFWSQPTYSNEMQSDDANIKSRMENLFTALRSNEFNSRSTGYTYEARIKLAQSADEFVKIGKAAIPFLLNKVEELNRMEDEVFAARSKATPKELMDFIQRKEKLSSNLKYDLLFILADLARQYTDEQERIAKMLIKSLAPYMYTRETIGPYFWALLRIGKPVVPYLLDLLNHENELIRCTALSQLVSIREEVEKTSKALLEKEKEKVLGFDYDCRAPVEKRKDSIDQWSEWYKREEKQINIPEIPSWFEALVKQR